MILRTMNSTYTATDKGDGAFEVVSDNPRYPGPYMVRFEREPKVGQSAVMRFLDDYGLKPWLITSQVQDIHEDPAA